MVEVNNDISKYEDFLENVLQKDLSELMKQKEDSLIKIQEIELGINELNTRTNLGCDLYVDTLIPNINKICVELSFGFFIELNLNEVPYILDLKEEFEHR